LFELRKATLTSAKEHENTVSDLDTELLCFPENPHGV
jgi:hypothetical protein